MFAAKQIFLGRSAKAAAPTARSYVQDGLIAMWDGIENAGWGVHDAAATTWKDLIGGNDFSIPNAYSFGDKSMHLQTGASPVRINAQRSLQPVTVEVLFNNKSRTGETLFIGWKVVSSSWAGNYTVFYNGKICTAVNNVYSAMSCTSAQLLSPNCRTFVCASGNVRCYLNGSQVTSTSFSDSMRGNTDTLALNPRGTEYYCDGNFYFIRAYSRALTAEEIAANYAIDKERFNLP